MVARTLAVITGVTVLIAACGSDGNDADGSSSGNGTSGAVFTDGKGNTPGQLVGPACATSNANGLAEPMSLVFMFDRSGSMKFNPKPGNKKWERVVEGITSFFKDQRSTNLSASVEVFPSRQDRDECKSTSYESPVVGMTVLPDANSVLINALNDPRNGPDADFSTPTKPAITGAVTFARTVRAQGKKVAVVLVTDGQPSTDKCNDNTVAGCKTEAGKGLPDIKTYVIGVGTDPALRNNLKEIAIGGGGTDAIMVSDANPEQITQDFVNALGVIRAASASCDYPLPQPPSGESLDVNRVNVQYTVNNALETLTYSNNCADGKGWQYDNLGAPTKILICKTSCDTLLADAAGKISIVFGCSTVSNTTK